MNPYLLEMELKERRRQMLEESERRHLLALFAAQRHQKNRDRLMLAVADLLIALGETLRRRHQHTQHLTIRPVP